MEYRFRCDCPITSAIDVVGDKWSLVIVKQMLLEGKVTFKDFTESDEAIATNILSARLKMLEEFKILRKEKDPNDKKKKLYHLTEKGLALAPIIVELALWSDDHVREFNPILTTGSEMEYMRHNKEAFVQKIQENYRVQHDLPKG